VVSLPPFQALLDEHGLAVQRFLVAAAGPGDADDCFQETWIAALRAYPALRRTDNLRAWLLTIAQRKAVDAHRARSRRAVPVADVPERPGDDGDLPPLRALDGEPAWGRVRELPEKQRMAVFLRGVADLSYPEVAQALGCSQDAARRNVHEGLKRLRMELT
jgi:DNA-directed RNA polymerase specialized sigma24 family protein